ncbi:hypothetical protein ACIQFU_37245 [Streptomyces sp. NPDC093065]|uniref:hypothetical protein n=1 Tax=Streptomyces sp. NPDC093065 TaxID=3366021 RepID=UPI00382BFC11
MGTLGLAAVLAVALAALRGTAGAITDWRQRRMEAAAEAAPLRAARLKLQEAQMKADAASTGSGGRVPSSNEYGRRSLARTGSGGGGSGGGGRSGGGSGRAGSGSSSGGRTGPGRSLASSGSPGSRTGSPSGSGGTGPGRKGSGSPAGGSGSSTTRSTGTNKGSSSGSGPGSGGKAGGSGGSSGKGSSSGSSSGSGGGRRPGVLGQLALDGSKRRTARQAGERKEAARQQKADLAERKRAGKDGDASKSTGAGGTSSKAPGATGKDGSKSAGTGRVTLGQALGDETRRRAEERLRRRRESPDPPFIHRVPRDGAEAAEGAAATTTGDGKSSPGAPAGGATTSTPGPTTGTTTGGPGTSAGGPTATGPGAGSTTGPSGGPGAGWEYWRPPGGGGRRNPWDSLFEAEWDAQVVWTVEQVDPPGAHAKLWEPEAIAPARAGLPAGAAPTTTAAAPAATVTTTKETRVSAPLIPTPRAGGAASEHLTDVTLDDVLKSLEKSKTDCFATYDECADLADKALKLRDSLHELADELAERHNVIGRLTSAAMHRLGESMDLLARRAEAMRTESLHAAESVELAHDEMHDAYKPVQQAAADAGLVMPSARIHNED